MQRYEALGIAIPNTPYVNANLAAGTEGSYPDARAFEATMMEIVNAITALGGVPAASWDQLGTQIIDYVTAQVAAGGGNKVAKAGDSMTGALAIVFAGVQLALRHSDNTATLKDHLRLFRGSSAGTRASIKTLGDAADGLSAIELQFLSAADALVKAFKFKNSGRLELGADPSLALEAATKQYVDGLIAAAASNAETQALALTTKYVSPGALGALVASTTQRGIQRNATDAEYKALALSNVGITPSNVAAGRFRSAPFTLVGNSAGTVSHTLGVSPSKYWLELVCIIANNGWVVGEKVCFNNDIQDIANSGLVVSAPSGTTLKWRLSSLLRVLNDAGSNGTFTPSEWSAYLCAEV